MAGIERIIHGIHGVHHEVKKANDKSTSSPWQRTTSESAEKKAAQTLAKMIDGRTFDPASFAFYIDKESSDTQFQMFDVMVNLITIWGDYYKTGQATPDMGKGYAMCKWAYEVSTMKHPQPPK